VTTTRTGTPEVAKGRTTGRAAPTRAEGVTEIRIRDAALDDVATMARIRAAASAVAYRGIVPDEILDQPEDVFIERVRPFFVSPTTDSVRLVADDRGDRVGFLIAGPERDGDAIYRAEVYLIYVDPDAQGRGVGRSLIRAAARGLLARGIRSMLLWTMRENTSGRGFYDRLGGTVLRERWSERSRTWSVAYGWQGLAVLAR